jgi:Skp family chaperone for outer membrane proteins
MKRVFIVTVGFVILSISVLASAQTRPAPTTTAPRPATPQPTPAAPVAAANVPAAKIAVVNTDAFRDEKVGITRYLKAYASLEAEFKARNDELNNLQARLKTIADEINKLSNSPVVSQQTIQTKQDEGERVQRELKYKKEQADADFKKRYTDAVLPISTDIGNALIEYANQRGITMVLDISKLEPAVLSLSPATDITLAFIADYNSKHP